jgi:hypothetical protein
MPGVRRMEGDSRFGLKAGRLRLMGGGWPSGTCSWGRRLAARAEKKPAPGGGNSSVMSVSVSAELDREGLLLRVGDGGADVD